MTEGLDPGHRSLSEPEKQEIKLLREKTKELRQLFRSFGVYYTSPELEQAGYRLDEAEMWTVRHITRPK